MISAFKRAAAVDGALALACLLAPRGAGACAVCFGAAGGNDGLVNGFWWGMVVLLTIVVCAMGALGWAVWSIERDRALRDA